MTNAKNVYALMLALVIVLSGCFGATSDESDAQDSESNDREQTDDREDMDREEEDREEERQARTWFTSGGTFPLKWNEDNVSSYGQYCSEWGHHYSQSTGEIEETYCDAGMQHQGFSDWNTTECTEAGGVATPHPGNERYYPTCTIEFLTINTSSGQALLIDQFDSISMQTTCDGVTVSSWHSSGNEFTIVTGSAMDCSHRVYKTIGYDDQSSDTENIQNQEEDIWSIVYAIQDVTVVEQVSE